MGDNVTKTYTHTHSYFWRPARVIYRDLFSLSQSVEVYFLHTEDRGDEQEARIEGARDKQAHAHQEHR